MLFALLAIAMIDPNDLVGKLFVKDAATSSIADGFTRNDLPRDARVLPPGSIRTMDYVPSRLNVFLDESDRVTRVTYG